VSVLSTDRPEAERQQADLLIREARRRQRRRRLAVTALVIAVLSGGVIAVRTGAASTGRAPELSRPRQVPSVGSVYGGLILHIDSTTTEITAGHPTYSWRQESYEETSPPYVTRTIDHSLPGAPPGTEGVNGIGINEQTYDPTNNTIYDPPTPPPPPGESTATPAQEAQIFQPYMSQYVTQLRAKLASGEAHVDGRATVNGQAAIKITLADSNGRARDREIDYVAANGSDVPIETIQGTPSSPDSEMINVYHTFQYLPARGNMGLLSLTAQHPNARIDTSLSDFRAADNRLFPNG
jgi:hypothetical protein